jgi:site-specific recombinase XerD
MTDHLPAEIAPTGRLLTAAEFQGLAELPPELEWFKNLSKGTQRIYKIAVGDFMRFTGIVRPEEFRIVTRAHVIAWRDDLERRGLERPTRRNRLAALSSLFEYLCDKNTVSHNPVKGVKRPKAESGEGATPTIGDHQARQLLAAPEKETLKAKRDRAILSTLLYHALRREELCKLKVSDFTHSRRGVPHLKVEGKGEKMRSCRCIPGPTRSSTITSRRPATATTRTARCSARLKTIAARPLIRRSHLMAFIRSSKHSAQLGFKIRPHALRATAATNALDHQADIAKVQEWLGHANFATTRIYDPARRARRTARRSRLDPAYARLG